MRWQGIWQAPDGVLYELFYRASDWMLHYWTYLRPLGTDKKFEACYDPGDYLIHCPPCNGGLFTDI